MNYSIGKSLEILSRTPDILKIMLGGLSKEWIKNNEGEKTWSPYNVVGHLVHGEKTDWIKRTEIILSELENKTFTPFDRFAQDNNDQFVPIEELLKEFKELRLKNLEKLKSFQLDEDKLSRTGIHPDLGVVQLKELLSTWTVHDLGHIAQLSRVMAKQYATEVGPWKKYLGILKN